MGGLSGYSCVRIYKSKQLNLMTNPLPFILSRHWRNQGALWTAVLSLLCLPTATEAMSLGRSRGAAIVGRPLDMSVLVSVDPQDATAEANCFNAEVFYGDTRINGQNVSITPLRTSPTELTVRVRSGTPVDEPFVTLYMRATCGQNLSRKYVLLSDSPSEPAAGVQAVIPQVLAPQEPRLPRVSTSPGSSSSNFETSGSLASGGVSDAASRALDRAARREAQKLERDLQRQERAGNRFQGTQGAGAESIASADGSFSPLSPLPSRAPARRKARVQASVEKKVTTPPVTEPQQSRSGRDRLALSPSLGSSGKASTGQLKLDLLEGNLGRSPNLRSSAELLTQPTTDEKARAQAATLWRVINSSPQDLLRDADRLKALEAEVGKMSELTKRQTQELGLVKADLVKAKGERFANPLVYGLGALTLASLGFGLWAWRRRQTSTVASKAPWWGGVEKAEESVAKGPRSIVVPTGAQSKGKKPASFAADPIAAALAPAPGLTSYAPMSNDAVVGSGFDSFVDAGTESGATPVNKAGLIRTGADVADSGFGVGVGGGSSTRVNAEELFDIQQQADFFLSLGQHDQAIDVLQNHISDNLETSAVAYLDLFDIYHKVNKREDFDTLRDEFNRVFNAQVPEFEHYGLSSRGLEDYAPAMQRIQALWPSAKVLDVIEESIFRKPDHETQPFDLAAYRELMLLYGVAKEISEPDAQGDEAAVDFDLTSPSVPQSGNPQATGFSHTEVHPLSGDVLRSAAFGHLPAAHNLGLDIDLDIFDAPVTPASPVAKKAADSKLDMDNAINFDLTIDSKFMPPKRAK
jgi:hypothetical protein